MFHKSSIKLTFCFASVTALCCFIQLFSYIAASMLINLLLLLLHVEMSKSELHTTVDARRCAIQLLQAWVYIGATWCPPPP